MNQREIEGLWQRKKLNVEYQFGEKVRLKSGVRVGETGRIVALYKLEPFPTYIIEFPDGTNESAGEFDIERAH